MVQGRALNTNKSFRWSLVSALQDVNVENHEARLGGADGVRTRDLLDAIEARSQLRYGPTVVSRVPYL